MKSGVAICGRSVWAGGFKRVMMLSVLALFAVRPGLAIEQGVDATAVVAAVPVLPVGRWTVQVREGDKLTISEAQGTLRIDYDMDVRDTVLVGHIPFKRASGRILLKEPVSLTPAQTRVIFEARGMRKGQDNSAYVQLQPIIRDQSGELLLYEPYPWPHLHNGTERWSKWTTRYFYGAEAGGATQNIFQPELHPTTGDGNAWPDGKLALVGFELQIQPPKFQREAGTVYLGTIELGGMRISYEHPYAYADSLIKSNGQYQLAAQIATSFQGTPVREFQKTLEYNPDDQSSCRQRITIPLGADGNYWIRFQVIDSQQQVVTNESLRFEVQGNPDTQALSALDVKTPPALGLMRTNPERNTSGVYESGAAMPVTVRVFPKGHAKLELAWKLMPYPYDVTLASGTQVVAFAGESFRDQLLDIQGQPDRDAYRLALTLRDDGKEVDRQEYVLGRKTDLSRPYSARQGLIRGREYVKKSAYFRTTFTPADKFKSPEQCYKAFCDYLDQASQITPYVTCTVDLAEFEILPGVYDMAMLDRFLDAAADRGCAVTFKLQHVDQIQPFRWLNFTRQRSYDGVEIYQHYYGCFSPVDPVYLDAWFRANKALHDRYATHPGFQGYYLMMAGGEWSAMLDKPWLGQLAGYEKPARVAFRAYLRDQLHWSLETLNKRWGANYPSWDQVEPPLPDFTAGARPDMRVPWLDFCRFKTFINNEYWFLNLAKSIRSYDPDHVIIAYGAEGQVLSDGLVDYKHGGGVPSMPGIGEDIPNWVNRRVGSIQEPHHPHRWNSYGDPGTRGWVLDWDLYTMFSIAGGGGMNLHVYYYPQTPLVEHYGGQHAYDRYEKFKPIFRELFYAMPVASHGCQVATYQDPSTLYTKHRTSFSFRLPDLSRWFELLTYAGVEYEALNPDHLSQYKLVLPNLLDEVLSQQSVEMLDHYVRDGGRMVMTATTGRYCPELGNEPFPLLRRLGIPAPTGEYVQQGEAVLAEVVSDHPLFDRSSKLQFFTSTNLKTDPTREEIRKAFFRWPYRWIPQTDYFGYFRDNKTTSGTVLARFASGAVAVSQHDVGKGQVIVFWGTPDYRPELLPDFMRRAAAWAGVEDARKDNPIRLMMEARNESLKRQYVILWQPKPGRFVQKLPATLDGTWWLDELVSDAKLGTFTGKELREKGVELQFDESHSPLQVIRLSTTEGLGWNDKYRQPPK